MLYKYKEIQSQIYLDLESGMTYYNVNNLADKLNKGYPYIKFKNAMSPSQIKNLIHKKKLPVKKLTTEDIDFAYTRDRFEDENSASLPYIEVIDARSFGTLVSLIESTHENKSRPSKKEFILRDWGLVESTDRKHPDLFYSIQRTQGDIKGPVSSTHLSQTYEKLSQKTLANKINSILKKTSDKNLKAIEIKPEQIDFKDFHKHATNVEEYVNEALYDKLISLYVYHKNETTKGKFEKLEDARNSTDTIRSMVMPYREKDSNKDFYFTESEVENLDKQINRRVDAVIKIAMQTYSDYEDKLNYITNRNIEVDGARTELKNKLNEDQWRTFKRELMKLPIIHDDPEIFSLIIEIINIYF